MVAVTLGAVALRGGGEAFRHNRVLMRQENQLETIDHRVVGNAAVGRGPAGGSHDLFVADHEAFALCAGDIPVVGGFHGSPRR